MPSATINVPSSSTLKFTDLLFLLGSTFTQGAITPSGEPSTEFTAHAISNGQQVSMIVEGNDFAYWSIQGRTVPSEGTITSIQISLGGTLEAEIKTSLSVEQDLLPVILAEFYSDPLLAITMEKFLLGFNWTYNGSNDADKALEGSIFGDGAEYNPEGDDVLVLRGGNDNFFSGDGKDDIDGGAGSDTLYGGKGNDTIRGGKGEDKVFGGSDNDKLQGDSGNDTVKGGSGDDTIRGGANDDKLYGDADKDMIYGGSGKDTSYGGSSNDLLYGEGGNDSLYGGTLSDRIYGGSQNDRLFGGDGKDLLKGGRGEDELTGGSGFDTAAWDGEGDEFTFTKTRDGIKVDHTGLTSMDEGTDLILSGIERIDFGGEVHSFADLLDAFGSKTVLQGGDFFN